ncbi:MAG: peptide chain release factor N(5)-glutamine methyltransferase [Endomicrobia bacterium]|nr:peptide chain release factor N(5)-glutamine methyltransferase [Endomicrobiia bacterium]
MCTIKSIYNIVKDSLRKFKISELEADIIICRALSIDKTYIYTYPDKKLSKSEILKIKRNLQKRLKHIPLAYIFNKTEFYGLNFYVDRNVLIPRQETEILVEEAIRLIEKEKLRYVADIGTGSGNIAISILKNLNMKMNVYATDINEKILNVAKKNAIFHKVDNYIKFIKTDKLNYFIKKSIKLEMIISNPPYVKNSEYKNLQPEIHYEPKRALITRDGLDFYKYFNENAYKVLNRDGYLLLEIHSGISNKICQLFNKNYKILRIIKDYSGLCRCIVLKKIYC